MTHAVRGKQCLGEDFGEKQRKQKAEEIRIRSLYRDLILKKRLVLSGKEGEACLKKLVGPDCAYHLYRNFPASD